MNGVTLASQSEIRAQILRQAGVNFETRSSGVDEQGEKARLLTSGATPLDVARTLADAKAVAISQQVSGWVIGADQTLEFSGGLFDKVADVSQARQRLAILRGGKHTLHTAASVARDGLVIWQCHETARMTMRPFSDTFLDGYLLRCGNAVLLSVGCYQIEGEGLQLFEKIEGDYFAILGLPLLTLLDFLRTASVLEI